MKNLSKLYYSPPGYWKGLTVEKLADAAKIEKATASEWLEKQVIWQIYLPAPRYVPRPHWTVSEPNQIHQADLLFLPHDAVGRKTYKYALVVIDIASRYKDAEPLTSKESQEVGSAFKKIYSRTLDWPQEIMVDPGREFMGNVSQLMEKLGVKMKRLDAGHHRAQAFVERANKRLCEKIFSQQYAQEMIREGRSREWVKRLPNLIKDMNNTPTRITGKEPDEVIKMKNIESAEKHYKRVVGFDEKRLPGFVKVRYLFAPGEYEGGNSNRATDPIWSF